MTVSALVPPPGHLLFLLFSTLKHPESATGSEDVSYPNGSVCVCVCVEITMQRHVPKPLPAHSK